MRRANFKSLRISAASRCSIPSREPRAGFIVAKACCLLLFHEQDFLRVIDLAKLDFNNLIFRRLHPSSNESGLDRQLAMAAIDQYTQLQTPGTPHAEQPLHPATRAPPL